MSATKLFLRGNEQSLNLYADYKPFNMVDGEGVRCSLYLSGCLFNCKGCYNKSIQNFANGELFTDELLQKILTDLEKPYCAGISLLGGDPMFNINSTARIVKAIREKFGDEKTIWMWTGFTYEEIVNELLLLKSESVYNNLFMVISNIDVLIDGRFKLDQFKLNLTHRGSYNQKIIDMKSSLEKSELVLWNDGQYLEYDNKILQKNHDN